MTAALAMVAPAREDWLIIAGLFALLAVVCAVGGAAGWLLDRLDARRAPTGLTTEQLADRGVTAWGELHPADAEGEVVA